jgi:hypothetical protein
VEHGGPVADEAPRRLVLSARGEDLVSRRVVPIAAVAAVVAVLGSMAAPAGADTTSIYDRLAKQTGRQFFDQHGYLPVDGVKTFYRAKKLAAEAVAHRPGTDAAPSGALAPGIGTSWQGVSSLAFSPPDPNGAIGPNSYAEIINSNIAVYTRAGAQIASGTLNTLTNHGPGTQLSDPMILWDPNTQRFYFNVWNVGNATMDWGFSKDANPQNINSGGGTAAWCSYETAFGYQTTNAPDYPKLGQTKNFLMIGVNFYPSFSNMHATRSDLLWVSKPQGSGVITTCPAVSTFKSGKFRNLRNEDGTQAFTPVPAIQTDASPIGFVTTMSDIECPDICGNGTLITVHILRPSPGDPTVPVLTVKGQSVTVNSFTSPPDAPQKNSANLLDTLDGRLTHTVSGIDPRFGALALWVAHTVAGGGGSEIRWYEIKPLPAANPTLLQSGAASSASLFVFNAGISSDRTVNPGGSAHGDSMVLGFTTSSATQFAAIQMVSKVGAGAQSAFVLVKQSTVADNNFTCSPCRWGDYGGATADPAASLAAAHGEVWLTNQWTNGNDQSWNWEATP